MMLVWLRRAERSLEAIADYIARENRPAAHVTIPTIRTAAARLIDNPALGRPGRVPGTRELVVVGTPYILPYRVQGEIIQILHVLHGARQWPERF
jgi:toxin ParE1/3/4